MDKLKLLDRIDDQFNSLVNGGGSSIGIDLGALGL